jgi:hypothetical protein
MEGDRLIQEMSNSKSKGPINLGPSSAQIVYNIYDGYSFERTTK